MSDILRKQGGHEIKADREMENKKDTFLVENLMGNNTLTNGAVTN